MKATLERLQALHEALIGALDANDVIAIEAAGRELDETLAQLRGFENWVAAPELKLAAERIGRLAEAAMMRVNVLNDQAKRRSQALAAARGQASPAIYGR